MQAKTTKPSLLAWAKALATLLWIGLCGGLAWAAWKLGYSNMRDAISRSCFRGLLRIVGMRLYVHGNLCDERPLLLVTNHLSYLDVLVLGAATSARFTPKSEIGGWPVIGGACRLLESVFIDRRPDKIRENRDALERSLANGNVICLFPEGTTGDGKHVLAFKSSFFSLAERPIGGRMLHIQPASIAYTRIRGLPIDSTQWPRIAWYGDMELVPHLLDFLSLGSTEAHLTFHPATTLAQNGSRKNLAAHCQEAIASALTTLP